VTTVKEVRNAYFVLRHTVFKEGKATTKGETKMVCVDQTGKPKRIPEDFKAKLLSNVSSEQ
jgi:acyl-CoA thioesterase FadM